MISSTNVILLTGLLNVCYCIEPTENYPNHVQLSTNYDLYWKINNETITFEAHFTSKWALFGISKDFYADFVTAWLKEDAMGHFIGHYANTSKFSSFVDDETNWLLVFSTRQDNTSTIKFSRPIQICDIKQQDLDIEKGLVNVVFAIGDEFWNEQMIKFNKSQIGNKLVDLINLNDQRVLSCSMSKAVPSAFTSHPTSAAHRNLIDLISNIFRLYWNITSPLQKMITNIRTKCGCIISFTIHVFRTNVG